MKAKEPEPKTFFLNERHQLTAVEKSARGPLPKFGKIDWASKGQKIAASLRGTVDKLNRTKDPLRGRRYFALTVPVATVPKHSDAKNKPAEFDEPTNYRSRTHARVLGRLGLDLIDVTAAGEAIVHVTPEQLEKLITTTHHLATASAREKARWSTIDFFGEVPASERLDLQWAKSLTKGTPTDVLLELQPLLTSLEADLVLRAVAEFAHERTERIVGTGQDPSGRKWARARLSSASMMAIAEQLSSLQSIHPPIYCKASAVGRSSQQSVQGPPAPPGRAVAEAPTVAILDVGVAAAHLRLQAFSRGPQVVPRGATAGVRGNHGAQVASRIVFGRVTDPKVIPQGSCRYLDVQVSDNAGHIDSKAVLDGLQAVAAAYPDVRVFNLSLGVDEPFESLDSESKKERVRIIRELDNFAFERHVALVVAAGNVPAGVVPAPAYPHHSSDGRWRLGYWACGFNTLVCGAFAGKASAGGVANPLYPSPFTMLGPGVCNGPVPDFGEAGGNYNTNYRMDPGMGELVCDQTGNWVEDVGTSLAAPLLAREVAVTSDLLSRRCPPGTRVHLVLVRAFLSLTAEACPPLDDEYVSDDMRTLSSLALGRGRASSKQLTRPNPASSILLWHGTINGAHEKARIVLPIPAQWIKDASKPMLRVVAAWDSPVNEANSEVWACRKVELQLMPGDAEGLRALRGKSHSKRTRHTTYPVFDRVYDLKPAAGQSGPEGDSWMVIVSYTEVAEYHLGIEPDPQQRVGLAMELYDASENPVSPQPLMQRLPVSMDVLAAVSAPVGVPIRVTGA